MTELLKFLAFAGLPVSALVLGIGYSLYEIYRIGERRLAIILIILALMAVHQIGESAFFFDTGVFRDPVVGEIPETGANVIAAGSVYYVLRFLREERSLKNEIEESRAEIEAVKDRLELIFENVNDAILLVDLAAEEIVEANQPAADMLRYNRSDLIGRSPFELHPHDEDTFESMTEALRPDGGIVSDQLSCRRGDGTRMPASVSASRATLRGDDVLLVVIRDNTQQKRYHTQLHLLSRVLRHNLRNDMSVVMGMADSIERMTDDPRIESKASNVLDKCETLLTVSEETRKLNEVLESEYERFELTTELVEAVEEVVTEFEDRYPNAEIETDLPEMALVRASDNIRWAIENLVENSIVHNPSETPRVRVSVDRETISRGSVESRWTTLTVADNGPGIPPQDAEVLRDDSQRTPTKHGSGLGLWIVQQLTHAFDGELSIDQTAESRFRTEVSISLLAATNGNDHS